MTFTFLVVFAATNNRIFSTVNDQLWNPHRATELGDEASKVLAISSFRRCGALFGIGGVIDGARGWSHEFRGDSRRRPDLFGERGHVWCVCNGAARRAERETCGRGVVVLPGVVHSDSSLLPSRAWVPRGDSIVPLIQL